MGAGGFVGRVSDVFAVDARERCKRVKIGARGSHDVIDGVAANSQRVGDERTMTAPGNGFGAHDGAEPCFRELCEPTEGGGKFRSLHVVGEAAKAGMVPAGVDRIWPRAAQAAELREMRVGDASSANGCGERGTIELRIVAGFRNGAHVDEAFDAVGFEEREKFVDGAAGMADGEDERARRGG